MRNQLQINRRQQKLCDTMVAIAAATPSLRRSTAIDGDADGNDNENHVDGYGDANDDDDDVDDDDDDDDDERWLRTPAQKAQTQAHAAHNDRLQTKTTVAIRQNNGCNNSSSSNNYRTTATSQSNIGQGLAPRASFPEIMQPRLSLNGLLNPSLMPSPRPLYRDHSSRSINPLTAYEQQMAELDGSFYASNAGYLGAGMGGSAGGGTTCTNLTVGGGSSGISAGASAKAGGGGGPSQVGGTGDGGAGGAGGAAIHTTELSITPTMAGDEQFIDLGSLRRFSIDRQSFLGKAT